MACHAGNPFYISVTLSIIHGASFDYRLVTHTTLTLRCLSLLRQTDVRLPPQRPSLSSGDNVTSDSSKATRIYEQSHSEVFVILRFDNVISDPHLADMYRYQLQYVGR